MTTAPPSEVSLPCRAWLTLASVAALLGVAFAPGVIDMVERWREPEGYYGHGPLVPLACAWVVHRERARLRSAPLSSSALGLVLVAAAVLVLAVSVPEDIHIGENAALLLAILGSSLALFGTAPVRRLWFALALLLFMIPLPQVAVANLTFSLKILAAKLAVRAIDVAGVPVILEGSTIHLPSVSLTVDDVCSGLRTLIALLAIAAIFAYLERTRWKAALVVALAAPIAIAANVVRILVLCAFAAAGSNAAQPGSVGHEATGLAVYAVAIALLMGIRALPREAAGPEASEGTGALSPGAPVLAPARGLVIGASRIRVVTLLLLLSLGAGVSVAFGYTAPAVERTTRTRAIPRTIGDWTGTDLALAPRTSVILGTDDILMRRYRRARSAGAVDLYVVHAADSRKVAHPPEICFSGGGFVARERAERSLPGAAGVPAIRMVLDRGPDTLLVYYWYRLDGLDTASYVGHQLESLVRRLRRLTREGSMVRLSTSVGADGLGPAEERIRSFAADALPSVMEEIP